MPMMRSIHGAACPYRSFRIKSYQSANRTTAPSIKRTRIGNDMASNLRLGNQPRGSHRAFKNFSSAGGCHRVRRVQISVKASASDFKSPTHHHTKNERHRHTKTLCPDRKVRALCPDRKVRALCPDRKAIALWRCAMHRRSIRNNAQTLVCACVS